MNITRETKESNNSEKPIYRRDSVILDNMGKNKMWEPMKTEGKFILLMVADTYLANDYEYSLRISTNDFSYFANTSLFEGNILRFRALASIKLFEDCLKDDEQNKEAYFSLLTTSIANLENAIDIYGAKNNFKEFTENHWGLALAYYNLGYIYEKFANDLQENSHFAQFCRKEHKDYLVVGKYASYAKARRHYNKSH